MSAIFGVLRFDGEPAPAGDLDRMGATLAHRGPDGRRVVIDGSIGLGHCLLRVNQEDRFEAQPLRDAGSRLTLVADCRIDNREALAAQFGIPDAALADMPDSALVLRAYKAWGEAAPEHLIGDFAYAVWDAEAGKLVLARDHMGQRYIFYHGGDGFLAFSTEIKGLWAVDGTPRRLREAAVGRRLTPRTDGALEGGSLYEGIRSLTGGETITVTADGSLARRTYWRPRADAAHAGRDERYYVDTYRTVLEEAVACRLRRLTKPAALMLSAGFDSAAIAGLAGPTVARQGRRLLAYSTVVSEAHVGGLYDIRGWVEACRRAMPHLDVRYIVATAGGPLDDLEQRFRRNDAMSSVVDHHLHAIFAQASADGARLLLDGVGGDYTVNPRGGGALAYLLMAGRLGQFLGELGPTMTATGQTLWQVLRREVILNLLPRRLLARWYFGHWWRPEEYPIETAFLQRLLRDGDITPKRSIGDIPMRAMRRLSLHFAAQHQRQSRPSRATPAASFGLELTRPMIDKRVVEFGLAVPEHLYVKRGRNRHLARTALADVYPPEFQTRIGPNDRTTPDMPARIDAALPGLIAEADRLAANAKVAAYIDFAKVRSLLSPRGPVMAPANLRKRRFAVYALMLARHMEWLSGDNRPQG
jgi:asparagine synthase (glutamine-hydrolysing)